ncbi:MRPL9 isoform 7, partial [Pan troglodytes]
NRGTVIVERWWKVPLAGEGRKPRLHRRHRVYKLVEDTKHRPKENLELILTQSVESKARAEALPLRLMLESGVTWSQ